MLKIFRTIDRKLFPYFLFFYIYQIDDTHLLKQYNVSFLMQLYNWLLFEYRLHCKDYIWSSIHSSLWYCKTSITSNKFNIFRQRTKIQLVQSVYFFSASIGYSWSRTRLDRMSPVVFFLIVTKDEIYSTI